jgi:cyclophilin family peptidyl-prolyl cis-trans isomerase/HEAT repeat protein
MRRPRSTRQVALVAAASLATAFALTACASAPPTVPGPDRERRALSDAEVNAVATLLRLEDHRRYEPARFEALAQDASTEVRRRTAVAAGRIGDATAAPLLVRMLSRDPSPAVRADAAFALGLLGDTSAVVFDALRAAAPRDWVPVRSEETPAVVEALAALGRLGTDRARSELVDALRRAHPAADHDARRIAGEALLSIWRAPAGAGRFLSTVRYLDHPDPEIRWRAALAVVRLAEPEGAPRLMNLLGDGDHRVRALAARGLAAQAADTARIGEQAIVALTAVLADRHPHVRINAARALATFDERAPMAELAGLLLDRDQNVAIAAAGALGTLGARAVAVLAGYVADETAPVPPRAAALAQLAALDPGAAEPYVTGWAAGDRPNRYGAARAAAPLGWQRAGGVLTRLVDDADPRIAVAATEALAAMGATPDLDADTRAAIRTSLLRLTDAEDVRQRAPARRGLRALLDPDDPARAAVDGESSARPPRPAPDDPDFYLEIVRRYVAPAMAGGQRPVATVTTPHGEIRLELLAEEAPLTVHNFITLAEAGFYDNGVWHRVVPNFVLQDGAPAGDPTGGPGWAIRDEINRVRYDRGIMGMALSGPDTGGSQWFITHAAQPHLDGGYTIFGRVTAGERAMDAVVQGDDVVSVRVRY